MAAQKTWGMLVQFDNPNDLLNAAEALHNTGYRHYECHSPFPIHGIDEATGEKRSRLGFIAGFMALIGGTSALALQGWTSAIDYPLVISGKPFFSYLAFFPVTFALAVLFAAVGALLGMIGLINLKFHHPIFDSNNFSRFSDDGFFISIEARDAKFDIEQTKSSLESLGGKNIEIIEYR